MGSIHSRRLDCIREIAFAILGGQIVQSKRAPKGQFLVQRFQKVIGLSGNGTGENFRKWVNSRRIYLNDIALLRYAIGLGFPDGIEAFVSPFWLPPLGWSMFFYAIW